MADSTVPSGRSSNTVLPGVQIPGFEQQPCQNCLVLEDHSDGNWMVLKLGL